MQVVCICHFALLILSYQGRENVQKDGGLILADMCSEKEFEHEVLIRPCFVCVLIRSQEHLCLLLTRLQEHLLLCLQQ